ncbi:MAG: hypothetical protein J7L64_02615 [Acidobacteria bacterium]|nr:hypothetical protein [Acidobacteriota bacterium]
MWFVLRADAVFSARGMLIPALPQLVAEVFAGRKHGRGGHPPAPTPLFGRRSEMKVRLPSYVDKKEPVILRTTVERLLAEVLSQLQEIAKLIRKEKGCDGDKL